ncbi:hypothetical protein BDZ94DRAFT_1279703 [Collybia nuda]|uniref:U4/U6 snRNA-associated-splicing factor PRP24 n=1 Tax=Collybia nuda TaxID=64659 RepID=A0A9P5YEQ5_9AGAR|nr:hypothetical protein BDZ94DRAFT_1279703 [Collybia nuda]
MQEVQALDALTQVLGELAEQPHNLALYAQHIRIARSIEGMEQSALETMVQFLAAPEEVWLALLSAKEASVDVDTPGGVKELLELYARAETDYLSISILQKHIQFIIDRHAHFTHGEAKPSEFEDMFTTSWTRDAILDVVNKGIGHLRQSHILWDMQRDWELEVLEAAPPADKPALVDLVDTLYLTRLKQPHSNIEETSQSYSSFTTKYKLPQDYEVLMIGASKIRSQGSKSYDRRESLEFALEKSETPLEVFARYIAAERRARSPDSFVLNTIYERAIAEAAKRTFHGEVDAEGVLVALWIGYCDSLRTNNAGVEVEHSALQRAIRSIPNSGEVAHGEARNELNTLQTPREAILHHKVLRSDVGQIVPVILARAGYEKRRMEVDSEDQDILPTLIVVLETGLELVQQASPPGDPKLRLEKYLANIYLRLAQMPDQAIGLWKTATRHHKNSYLVWLAYTDLLIKLEHYEQARKIFTEIHTKNLDWPEAIWEAWAAFEHMHGSVEEVDTCFDKIEKAAYQVHARRAKEAEKVSYQAMQMAQAVHDPLSGTQVPDVGFAGAPMDIDPPRGQKRGAEDETSAPEAHKKAKTENSTIFVADLPGGCGKVREVKITELPNALVATVEFFERDSIPPALTKDKKRVRDQEVAVHLAWKSTLYVTNFPESADDVFIRDLFGKYGTIFDVRWPSKKYKNSRRFCYIQFTSPDSAQRALELHGRQLEPDQPMNVFISNPEHKKERTDQDANEREIYVAGLSRFTTKDDLETLFKTYGVVKEVRMAVDKDNKSKGFAFVEFEEEKEALAALEANNHELKKRRIGVTLADSRVRARNRNVVPDTGLSRLADVRNRSVRIRNLPVAAQEGLLQQTLEKIALVKRVEVFVEICEAVVELESAAEVGKLLLRTEPIVFCSNTLQISEDGRDGALKRQGAPPPKTGGLFVPRATVSKPRAGLGHTRKRLVQPPGAQTVSVAPGESSGSKSSPKGQDDFRKMLG